MTTKFKSDRRRGRPRRHVEVSCELTILGEVAHAETRNLSTGGAAVTVFREVRVDDVVTVCLFLTQDGIEDPEREPFECAASVRWTQAAGKALTVGLQFLAPSEEQRQLLRDFLAAAD